MIRSFIAIPVRGDAARQIRGRQSPIPGARAVPDEDFHLTLAFLGDQPEAKLRDLADALETIAFDPVDLVLEGVDLIGKDRPRALALKAPIRQGQLRGLENLHHDVERVVRGASIDLQRRRFRPHVTLYRLPRSPGPDLQHRIQDWLVRQATAPPITFTATMFELIESRFTPDGPVYTTLANFPFAGLSAQFNPEC